MLPCAADQRQEVLAEFVAQHGLHKAPCNLVLPPSKYQLLLVEAPDVPEDEMRAAVRWRLKDLVTIPLEAAAIDVCSLPLDATRGGKRMAFVVVTEIDRVQRWTALISASGLRPSVIDINEMALRNLAMLLPADETEGRGVVIVRLQQGAGSLGLCRDGNVYLSRHFELNYGGGLLDDLPEEELTLEIQRSVDYAERQMGQAPPSAIYICGDNVGEHKMTETLKSGLATPLRALPLQDLLPANTLPDEAILQACVGAVGGVLRHGEWV